MEQVFYSLLSGAGSGGAIVFLFVQMQSGKIKEQLRKEIYQGLEKVENEANKYTDAKHNDVKEMIIELKQMVAKIQDILITKQ